MANTKRPAAMNSGPNDNNAEAFVSGLIIARPFYAVKSYPDLGERVLHAGEDLEYRAWLLAHAIDKAGSGRVRLDALRREAARVGMRGFSRTAMRRLLLNGECKWWRRRKGADGTEWLYLAGLGLVCERLDVKLRFSAVLLPVKRLKRLGLFRAELAHARFGRGWSNPISRKTMTELTGRTARALSNYRRALGTRVRVEKNATPDNREWQRSRGAELPSGCYLDWVNGQVVLMRRLANSYRVLGRRKAPRGQSRMINKSWNARHSPRTWGGSIGRRSTTYYRNARAARRRIQSLEEGDEVNLVGVEIDGKKARRGAGKSLLWTHASMNHGRVSFA